MYQLLTKLQTCSTSLQITQTMHIPLASLNRKEKEKMKSKVGKFYLKRVQSLRQLHHTERDHNGRVEFLAWQPGTSRKLKRWWRPVPHDPTVFKRLDTMVHPNATLEPCHLKIRQLKFIMVFNLVQAAKLSDYASIHRSWDHRSKGSCFSTSSSVLESKSEAVGILLPAKSYE